MTDDILNKFHEEAVLRKLRKNRRIHEIADELRRRCQLYETKFRGGKENVIARETEQLIAEQYAKEKGLWLPFADISRKNGR